LSFKNWVTYKVSLANGLPFDLTRTLSNKKSILMKQIIYACFAFAVGGCLSCNDGSRDAETRTDTTTVTSQFGNNDTNYADSGDKSNSVASGTAAVSLDAASADFVTKAASGSMKEIQLGQHASQNAVNARVKNFGMMMAADHSNAAVELKSLAGSHVSSTMMPDHQKHFEMLTAKTGAAFDKAYMDMMIKDHKETIDMFKKATSEAGNESIKLFATKTLPVIQKHLDSAQSIRKGL